MASRLASIALACLLGILSVSIGLGSASTADDRAECAEKLVGLAPCLPYVGGSAKNPTPDCCAGLKTVVDKSAKCLCILVKDRNDPKLEIKFNSTLALNLPNACNVPLNLTTCIDLLNLAPNSTAAKVFSDFEKSLDKLKTSTNATLTPGHGTSTTVSPINAAWKRKTWQGLAVVIATFFWYLTPQLIAYV